ncbi:mannose-1-phosphate guanylyltransferase/mannose-6-phosphate isomerase [Catenovulum adriaticum]|uniref:mannose-1-phosphate guanylyltransferase n=1 Tax=Catenovulum adriaticum TaxID=2984846 RepID=A0ABY7AM32_9ALTE|nr:mannose-1-phosphate guanylyltransferase/mannose-6-phosphate isomerase [Catenovulum sp. TS8]WAJ69371.1 mannose-1-phosphate guanylyltransferase/mannose-6-phosphate isomerase [Catenovulum sp. TS8]
MFLPIVMAGGTGSRLWPLSRSVYPKQFLSLTSDNTMLQDTVLRLAGSEHKAPLVICNEASRFMVAEQLRAINALQSPIILEPVGRNTAPAIALAALQAVADGSDPVLLVLAADHVIAQQAEFLKVITKAETLAEQGAMVTFGIVPSHAETGYGYIKRGNEQGDAYQVASFVEKPDLATATEYFNSGEYYWNSGMFMFKASRYLAELEKHQPQILAACKKAIGNTASDLDFVRVDKAAFEACPDDSIDYAVMEKTGSAVVIPLDAQWSDVGSWSALWDVNNKDQNGNAAKGDTILHDTNNCLVQGGDRLVATVGVEDLVIVDTKDALLVAAKDKVQNVKQIVSKLKNDQRSEHEFHREVYRPWGKYDSIDNGERYQVKRITVKPGAKLSVQMHHHRAEHWIVVSGTAKVTNGDKDILLTENQSTYIPVGVIHALENPGKVDLELIEVQSGSYLGEDDIVRFEDKYGRV